MTFNVPLLMTAPCRAVAAFLLVGVSASLPMSAAAQEARWIWDLAREIRDREPARALHLMARAARLADTPEIARVIAADAAPLMPHLRVVSLPIDQFVIEVALTKDGTTAFAVTTDDDVVTGHDALRLTGLVAGAPKAERIGKSLSSLEHGDYFAVARDGHVQVWNTATGKPLGGQLPFADATGSVLDDDALWIAVWNQEGQIRIWDIATGRLRSEAFIGEAPTAGALLPKIDRLVLVADSPVGRFGYLIDTGSGEVLCDPIPGVIGGWSLGGEGVMVSQLVEGSSCDARPRVLDHRSCTMLQTTPDDPAAIVVEPGGRWFVASFWTGLPRVFDTATGEARWQLQSEADGTYSDVSVDPSWRRLLRPTYEGIEVFSLETGERTDQLFPSSPIEIQWSEDGRHILAWSSGSTFPTLTFWHYEASLSSMAAQWGDTPTGMTPTPPQDGSPTGSEFRLLTMGGPIEDLAGASLLANGPRAVLWSPGGRIWLWDLEQDRSLGAPIEVGRLFGVVSDSAGKVILAKGAKRGGLVLLVDPVEPDPMASRRLSLREGLEEIVWIDDVRLLARFADRSWAVVAADTGEVFCAPPAEAPEPSPDAAGMAGDGSEAGIELFPWQLELAAPNRLMIWKDGSVTTWDLNACRLLGDPIALGVPDEAPNSIYQPLPFLSRSADGSNVLAWGASGLAWIEPESGRASRTLTVETELLRVLVIGERMALVASSQGAEGLLSLESGAVLPFGYDAGSHAASPDQRWLAISAGEDLAELIDLRTGQRTLLPNDFQAARFSDDGQRLVVQSWRESVSAFDLTHLQVDNDGEGRLRPRWSQDLGEGTSDLHLSGDGQHVLFWPDQDGAAAVYDFTTGERTLVSKATWRATFVEDARYLLTSGLNTLLLDRATGLTIRDFEAGEPRDSFSLRDARFDEVSHNIVTCHQDGSLKRVRFRHWTLAGDPAGPPVELVGSCHFSALPQRVDSSWLVAVTEGELVWSDIGHGVTLPPRSSTGGSLERLSVAPSRRRVAAWSITGHAVIEAPPVVAVDPTNLETWLVTRTANRLGELGRTVVALPYPSSSEASPQRAYRFQESSTYNHPASSSTGRKAAAASPPQK